MAAHNIIIIGAGMAGLMAAIALRREGHHVTMLEKSTSHKEAGAAIHLGANISGFSSDLGLDLKGAVAIPCEGLRSLDGITGQKVFGMATRDIGKNWKNTFYMHLRPDFHAQLKTAALDRDGKGPVPDLVLGAKIVEVDAEGGVVKLEDGRTYTGDVIVGADGIHSITRSIVQSDAQIKPFEKSCYRWLMPRATLLEDPGTRPFVEDEGWFGDAKGLDTPIVWYPCRDNTVVNFAAFVPSELSNAMGADYNQKGSKELLWEAFSGFCPGARKAPEYDGDDLSAWNMYDLDEMPSWHKGKLVLMGDASDPFSPFMGM